MLTSKHLNEKSREVCIKARSPLASLTFIGQATRQPIGWRVVRDDYNDIHRADVFNAVLVCIPRFHSTGNVSTLASPQRAHD